MKDHWAIFVNNQSNKKAFSKALLEPTNRYQTFSFLKGLKGALFSQTTMDQFLEEEDRHGLNFLGSYGQSLRSMSSGEQKRALLRFILGSDIDFIILDNPFDNLDLEYQEQLREILTKASKDTLLIQLVSRAADVLPFIQNFAYLEGADFHRTRGVPAWHTDVKETFTQAIPGPLTTWPALSPTLVELTNVSVSYHHKIILKNISWKIKRNDFWQLKGKNGSGKTTLLSMITGDNPKAYGQNIQLFGKLKGSGESVWDLKEKIGYYSPAMTDKFSGRHSVENMIISGLTDSIGLYTLPTETQRRYSEDWLRLIGLWEKRTVLFSDLTLGEQRLTMVARAMVKHPPLLILDEPTVSLDDASARLLVTLVNKMAHESLTAIVFVSHRNEPGLRPKCIYQLQPGEQGSTGIAVKP